MFAMSSGRRHVPQVARLCVAAVGLFAQLALVSPAHALTLISEDEARRPASTDLAVDMRGITRGPTVTVMSPAEAAPAKSPVALKVRFEAHGGSAIDVASVKVTYLRKPAVDLTERLKPFITAAGIEVDQADVAAGRHLVRIELKDAQGRRTSSVIKFSVDR